MARRQADSGISTRSRLAPRPTLARLGALAALLAVSGACTVTPEPRRAEPETRRSAVNDEHAPVPPARPEPGDAMPEIGDTSTADALEALRWIAALFATGIDTGSETNPLTARNHADRSAEGAMGAPPHSPGDPSATEIVDGILRRFREGEGDKADPREKGEASTPPQPPPKDQQPDPKPDR